MKNKVEIIGFYGSDLTHAQSAWTSTSRDLTEEKINRIPSLLKMLADNGHETPFEKSSFHFLVTVDQASHFHLLKHRIGVSINGECLTGDSLITFINSGRGLDKITISDLYDKWTNGRPHQNTDKDKEYVKKRLSNKKLRVLNEDTGVFEIGHVKNVMMSGLKEVYKITTESGNVIKCSANHKILTIDGWKTLNDGLTTKDFLALNRKSTKLRVHYSKIISIEKIGEEMCYDLEVDHKYHNFVANGVIVHNSARYKELKEDKFYLPEDWWDIKVTPDVKDDLNYPQEEYMDWFHALELYTQLGNKLYHKSLEQLTPVIGRKRAKESSRYFKTMNSQITMDIMFNWRSFVHFYKLRSDEAAQLEIREISEEMLKLIKNIDGNPFKHTIEAFNL